MDQPDELPDPLPAGWLEALERGEADAVAGRVVPVDAVLAMLWESIHQMEAKSVEHTSDAA